jgi:hypothetical protein
MSFLRRLFDRKTDSATPANHEPDDGDPAPGPAELDDAERAHELEVLRGEQQRLGELQQRQLRYADHAWEPPAQGGERRADDEIGPSGG